MNNTPEGQWRVSPLTIIIGVVIGTIVAQLWAWSWSGALCVGLTLLLMYMMVDTVDVSNTDRNGRNSVSTKTFCDNCGVELGNPAPAGRQAPRYTRAIRGERANGMGGGGLPDGKFDWCLTCATIAFDALRTYNESR